MWSIRDRATFAELRQRGRRVRSGPLWVSYLPGRADEPVQVGFALGRRVGGAVVRNRLRRRLRAVLVELDQSHQLPPGVYLVGASPPAAPATFEELSLCLRRAIIQLRERS